MGLCVKHETKLFLFALFVLLGCIVHVRADVSGGRIVLDPTGYALAVWEDDVRGVVQASTFVSPNWTPPVTISDAGTIAYAPVVAINSMGQGVAVWLFQDPETKMIRIASSMFTKKDESWGKPITLSATYEDVINCLSPYGSACHFVRIDDDGHIVAFWHSRAPIVIGAFSAAADFNGVWTAPMEVSH